MVWLRNVTTRYYSFFFLLAIVSLSTEADCLTIDPSNVQAIAVYGKASHYGIGLEPGQIIFNVTDPSLITTLITSIDYSREMDCSGLGAQSNARVYIRFKDGSVETYDLFGMWRCFSKLGLQGGCYLVSGEGQTLFKNNAQ